jgi:L,D-transpeptidase ErfK/SrfK
MFYTIYMTGSSLYTDVAPFHYNNIIRGGFCVMAVILRFLFIASLFLFTYSANAEPLWYGARLCQSNPSEFECYRVHRGDSWQKLFPDSREQDLVMRINRMGIRLQPGMLIAIPRDADRADIMEFSPFPQQVSPFGQRTIVVSTSKMAWGAYEANGSLVRWGPASSARGYCPDIGGGCHTVLGHFQIYNKEGEGCFSRKFPVGRGGAPMPYCMFFHGGYALHGSYEVPGYNASHGCVRLLVPDAQWLNEDFTEIGTPVIVSQ